MNLKIKMTVKFLLILNKNNCAVYFIIIEHNFRFYLYLNYIKNNLFQQ